MRRPSQRQHVTKERRFSRRQRVLKDLAHGGHVEIVVHDDSGRIMYISRGQRRPPPVVDRFLYSRYAGQRLAAERESRGERGVRTASEDLAELAELVRRFTLPRPGALAPGESLRRARAARELRQYVSHRVGEVDGETERTRERLLSPGIYR
jgi:hypothetical protein